MTTKDTVMKDRLVELSLFGLRSLLESRLGIKNIVFTINDSQRGEIARNNRLPKDFHNKNIKVPFAWVEIQGLKIARDRNIANYATRRNGLRSGTQDAQRVYTTKAFILPCDINLTLHYVESDPISLINMASAISLMAIGGSFNFSMTLNGMELHVISIVPEDVSIPTSQLDDESNPGMNELQVSFVLQTYSGSFRKAFSVQDSTATVVASIVAHDDHSKVTDIEVKNE